MNTDTQLLDFLTEKGKGMQWICRPSKTGRGYRLHTFPKGEFETGSDTPREAIAQAMKEEES